MERHEAAVRSGQAATYPDGVKKVKLGLYSYKSYITYKEPDGQKWPLLVNLTQEQASRNECDHQTVMSKVFNLITSLNKLPSKQMCKQHVLDILAQKGVA